MSCNGCRVLRKGCSDSCFLRQCLKWIESPDAQGHATVFVAKFFGRAGMMALISSVPEAQRPALFQSLLYEACGRTVNPVYGAVGLLCSGNWNLCQSAVETVMNGGLLCPAAASLSSTGKPVAAMMMHSFNNNNNNNNNDNSSNNNNNKATSTKLPRVRLGRGFIQTPPEYYTDNNNSNKQEGCVEDNNNMYTVIDNNNNNSNKRRRSLEEVVECNNRTTSSPLVRRTNRPRRQQQQQQQQEDVAAVKEEEEVEVEEEEEEEEELGLDLTLGTSTSCRKKRNLQENISDEDYTTPLPPKRTASPCPSEADSDTTELSISPWSSIQSRPLLRRDVAKTAAF